LVVLEGVPSFIVALFALAVIYLMVTLIALLRSFKLPQFHADQFIAKNFYVLLLITSVMRLAAYSITCGLYSNNAFEDEYFISDETMQSIKEAEQKTNNVTMWFPVEAYPYQGMEVAPHSLTMLFYIPEYMIIVCFLFLVW